MHVVAAVCSAISSLVWIGIGPRAVNHGSCAVIRYASGWFEACARPLRPAIGYCKCLSNVGHPS